MAAVPAAAFVPVEALTKLGRPRRPPPLGKLTDAERRELEQIEAELDALGVDRTRPRTRAGCPPDDEPCPWIGCRHHAATELTSTGAVRLRFPHLDILDIPQTCTLRAADTGGMSLDEVAPLLNISRAQVGLDERRALTKVRQALERQPRRTAKP